MIARPATIREAINACKRRLAQLDYTSPDLIREQRFIRKLEAVLAASVEKHRNIR